MAFFTWAARRASSRSTWLALAVAPSATIWLPLRAEILRAFGPDYAHAGAGLLRILVAMGVFAAAFALVVTVLRVRQRLRDGALLTILALVVGIVRHHLLLPDTATRRDPEDPGTMTIVRDAVADSVELLELLHALAPADAKASGPAAWSDWKAGLIADLVRRSRAAMVDGPSTGGRAKLGPGRSRTGSSAFAGPS